MKNFFIRLAVVCMVISMVSCSKDSSSGSSSQAFTPKFSTIDVSKIAPASMQQNAPEAYNVLNQMSSYMAMPAAYMQNPHGKTGTNSGTWTSGQYTIVYTYGDNGTQYNFNYVATNGGVEFFTISGWENMDGSAGAWNYNINAAAMGDPNGTNYVVNFAWNANATGGYDFDMTFDFGDDMPNMHYVVHEFNATSGEFFVYEGADLTQECHWTATGGTWVDYDFDENYSWTN